MDVRRFLRDDLQGLAPYHVNQPSHRAKLDANESPFNLPPEIQEELANAMDELPFHRYPDGGSDGLRSELSRKLGVDKEQIVVGNGSDELIANFMLAFGRSDACVAFPTPTFSMYQILAQIARLKSVALPLDERFDLNAAQWLAHLNENSVNLVFMSYPNNPTGNTFSDDVIRQFFERSDTLVMIDEAYYEFSGKTFIDDLKRYPNVIVSRTFSKAYGLAALRVGYLVAHPDIIGEIDKVRLPYNLNRFSQLAATRMLEHHQYFADRIALTLQERERVFRALERMEGIHPFPTNANFILFRIECAPDEVFQHLLNQGVLVRNLNNPGPLQNCLRVTIGTPAENDMFLDAMKSRPV